MTRRLQPNRSPRRLTIESLESRSLLAGNVVVSVTDGVLNITGDDAANEVQIRQIKQTYTGEWPGLKVEISGNYQNRSDTLINGQSEPVILEGIKGGAEIDLGDGNNALRIANLPPDSTVPATSTVAFPGVISITAGSGADDIRVYLKNGKSVAIDSGRGADYTQVTRSALKDLTITTDPASLPGVIDNLKDRVQISNVTALGDVTVNGGERRDFIEILHRSRIDGKFTVDFRGGGTETGSGTGNDLLVSAGAFTALPIFNGPVSVVGSTARDYAHFQAVINGSFHADLANNNDRFFFDGISNVKLSVSMGEGTDSIFFTGQTVGVTLSGGNGFDTLWRGAHADLGDEKLFEIEADRDL